jgi:hypothetical protein
MCKKTRNPARLIASMSRIEPAEDARNNAGLRTLGSGRTWASPIWGKPGPKALTHKTLNGTLLAHISRPTPPITNPYPTIVQ